MDADGYRARGAGGHKRGARRGGGWEEGATGLRVTVHTLPNGPRATPR